MLDVYNIFFVLFIIDNHEDNLINGGMLYSNVVFEYDKQCPIEYEPKS